MRYTRYNKSWYKVRTKVNGKYRTGYVHKNDIGKATSINVVNPMKTYTHQQMITDIKRLEKMYPDLIQYQVVGKSEYGRDIYAVSIGKGKSTTFINGSII